MTDPMELVGRMEAAVTAMQRRADDGWKMMPSVPNDDMTEALERCESYCDSCHGNAFSGWSGYEAMFKAAPDAILTLSTLTEAATCIREMVEQRARLYDAVSLGFYDGFRDAITRDHWEDCHDYAASKGADYAKAVMARILAKQAADPTRRLNPSPQHQEQKHDR